MSSQSGHVYLQCFIHVFTFVHIVQTDVSSETTVTSVCVWKTPVLYKISEMHDQWKHC